MVGRWLLVVGCFVCCVFVLLLRVVFCLIVVDCLLCLLCLPELLIVGCCLLCVVCCLLFVVYCFGNGRLMFVFFVFGVRC